MKAGLLRTSGWLSSSPPRIFRRRLRLVRSLGMNLLRLLRDPPAAGAWNMAVDEALLESAAAGVGTLRLYEWQPATLSLGYFQAAADRAQHAASRECPLVRRASGGGAILHDRELTYSIALPQSPTAVSATTLYDVVHQSLIAALVELGVAAALFRPAAAACVAEVRQNAVRQNAAEPFLCFQRRSCGDIICHDAKIVGSAQRRRRGAVLQHGSILLALSLHAPELPGIAELTGQAVSPADLIDAWLPRLSARLPARLTPGEFSTVERQRAEAIRRERFGAAGFTQQR